MAKKKRTNQSNPTKKQENAQQMKPNQDQPHNNAIDDSYDTAEKPQEVMSLSESKKLPESELEIESLKAELALIMDAGVEAEVGKDVISVFVESQVGVLRGRKEDLERENELLRLEIEGVVKRLEDLDREMSVVVKERDEMEKVRIVSLKKLEHELRDEIERHKEALNESILEKDVLKQKLDAQVEETQKLREELTEIEDKERKSAEELEELKYNHEIVTRALEESESKVESVKIELASMDRRCVELENKIEDLNGERDSIMREKDEMQRERDEQEMKNSELKNEIYELKATISSLREGEEKWQMKFLELNKTKSEMIEKLDYMNRDNLALLEEKKEKEREIESLMEEKSTTSKKLSDLEKELESMKRSKEEILEEKSWLEQAKVRQESEIKELKKTVDELEALRDALKEVTLECDEAKKAFEEERANGVNLESKILEMSKKMEETLNEIEGLRSAHDGYARNKKELEQKHKKLVEDRVFVLKELRDAQMKIIDLETSTRLKSEMFKWALALIRNTAHQMSEGNGENGEVEGVPPSKEMKPYLEELNAIKSAFRSKEEKVEEMKKMMESLQWTVVDVKKKKSFWTLMSSATTILATVLSVAYVARSR